MNAGRKRSNTLTESLIRAQLIVVVAAIVLASLGASLVGYRYLHEQVRRHLSNLARVTAIETQPALLFDQVNAAAEILRAIPAQEGVTSAELYDANGHLVASHSNPGKGLTSRLAAHLNGEQASAEVVADQTVIGEVRLRGGQEPLLRALFGLIGTDVLVIGFVSLLSIVVSRRNTRRIAMPLTHLRTIMRQAIDQRDFTQRAPLADIVEVDDLRTEFNALLDEIAHRDQTLNTQNALLRRLALHDTLTGLANRAMFERALPGTLKDCSSAQTRAALLYLDIDSFKGINDQFGHATGDRLLCEIAERLRQWLPQGAIAARIGGDEFVALITPWNGDAQADPNEFLADLQAALKPAIRTELCVIHPVVSIGMALYPEDAGDAEALLQAADKAMYTAKARHYEGANVTRWTAPDSPAFAPMQAKH